MQTGYIDGKKIEELTTPKTSNSYRAIPFFDETEECFIKWKEKQDYYKKKLGDKWRAKPEFGNLVFTNTKGSPVTRYVIIHDLKKVVDNINSKEVGKAYRKNREPRVFEHLNPHAFRHTFATRCFEKGMEPLVVQSIMGHANYATTVLIFDEPVQHSIVPNDMKKFLDSIIELGKNCQTIIGITVKDSDTQKNIDKLKLNECHLIKVKNKAFQRLS